MYLAKYEDRFIRGGKKKKSCPNPISLVFSAVHCTGERRVDSYGLDRGTDHLGGKKCWRSFALNFLMLF